MSHKITSENYRPLSHGFWQVFRSIVRASPKDFGCVIGLDSTSFSAFRHDLYQDFFLI